MAKYYPSPEDSSFSNAKAQEEFEAKLFTKTSRQNAEVVTFDGYTVVYKTRSDVTFYVVGYEDENELILLTALNTMKDTLGTSAFISFIKVSALQFTSLMRLHFHLPCIRSAHFFRRKKVTRAIDVREKCRRTTSANAPFHLLRCLCLGCSFNAFSRPILTIFRDFVE